MKVFKLSPNAEIPAYATTGSACFDLQACLDEGTRTKAFNPHNREMEIPVKRLADGRKALTLHPEFRTLVPTGLIFDVPEGYVLKAYSRSGMALKYGLRLANDVGIIDSDYIDQTYIMIMNDSDTPIQIYHGDRLAQAMLEVSEQVELEETLERPVQKTDRVGGLGSTGVERKRPGPKPGFKKLAEEAAKAAATE